MCGQMEVGKCEVCGKEAQLHRTYFYTGVQCECHSPEHFILVRHCKECKPKMPRETTVVFNTEKLKKLILVDRDKLDHLLNCMCNQKYIHEQSPEIQKEWQEVIDKAYHEMRGVLSSGNRAER